MKKFQKGRGKVEDLGGPPFGAHTTGVYTHVGTFYSSANGIGCSDQNTINSRTKCRNGIDGVCDKLSRQT